MFPPASQSLPTSSNELFNGFARVWTPLLGSMQLREKPVPVTLAGEKLVVFRSAEGPAVLLDRCPHRGVALSAGRVRDGCLECPFHGWQFDGAGRVRLVPWNPDAAVEKLSARALPVLELGGVIWVYTEPGRHAPEPPWLAKRLASRHRSLIDETVFATHWSRAMENAIDAAHLPFVHRRSIGFGLRRAAGSGSRMDTRFHPTEYGGRVDWSVDGATRGHKAGSIEFFAPNVMQLRFPGDEKENSLPLQLMAVVPVDMNHTRMVSIIAPGVSLFRTMAAAFGRRITREDKRVVESSQPAEIPPAGHELSVRSDVGTLAFRKYYDAHFRNSFVTSQPR